MTTTATAPAAATATTGEHVRRPNALNQAYDRKRADIDERIAKLQKRLEALKTGNEDTSASSAAKGERGRVIGELKEARERMRALRDDAQTDMKQLKDVQAQIKKQRDDVREQKDKLPFKTVSEIDSRISQLEERIEVGSMSLGEEKQVLQDISKLKKTKKTLEQLESGASVDGRSATDLATLRMKEEVFRQKMTTKYGLVDEEKKKVDQLEAALEQLDGGKEIAQQRQKARFAEMDKLRKDIDAAYDERRALIDEHKDAKQKQREQWERNQARREQEAQRQKTEDDIWELEERLRVLNPASAIDAKIDECVNVHNHFAGLLPSVAPLPACEVKKPVVDGEFVALKAKADREEVWIQTGASNKKKHQSSTQQQPTISKLPLQILAALADLQLPVPKQEKDISALLTAAAEKKAAFEKQRDAAMAGIKSQEAVLREQIAALQLQLE